MIVLSRLDAYQMWKQIQITQVSSPELLALKKKMRYINTHACSNSVFTGFDLNWVNRYIHHIYKLQVHLIRLSANGTELFCEGLFSHPNEIWDLVSCPFDQRIFSTVYSNGMKTCLFTLIFVDSLCFSSINFFYCMIDLFKHR